jgi:DNA-binding NtrC family response regulator
MKLIKNNIAFHSLHLEPVLITGASGTGKRLVAHLIHNNSCNKEKTFKEINCLTFSQQKPNFEDLINLPEGGTIYISSTEKLPLYEQLHILNLLDENFSREKIKVHNLRLIFSTQNNLIEYIDNGSLHKAFFDTISNFEINVPSLNEIKDDIKNIATSFVNSLNEKYSLHISLSNGTSDVLKKQLYLNNVYDLKNVIIKSYVHAMHEKKESILPDDISKYFEPYIVKCIEDILVPIPMPESKSLGTYIEEIKIKIYESALNHTSKTLGKKSQKRASELLNEDQSTISRIEKKRKKIEKDRQIKLLKSL